MSRAQVAGMPYSDAPSNWQPQNYAEMGAAVPFTSPELAGARARQTAGVLEFTLPNPAGKRGIYILDSREVGRYCQATLHDRRLAALLPTLKAVTPASLLQTARGVAREGYAGRAAARAAEAAAEAERRADLAAQLTLARLLVRQVAGSDAAAADMPARKAIEVIAERSGHPYSVVRAALESAASLAASVGLEGSAARAPALLARIEAVAAAMVPLAAADTGRTARAAALVAAVAGDTAALLRRALALMARRLENVTGLLIACLNEPAAVASSFRRLDWLQDGWAWVCLILEQAAPGRVCAAVNEMALVVPTVPAEAIAWFGGESGEAGRQALRAEAMGFSDWRIGGRLIELTARNEALRALAA